VFWPRDGITERVYWKGRKSELTRKIDELTQVLGLKLVVKHGLRGELRYVTEGRLEDHESPGHDSSPTRFDQIPKFE
jgi:hypothetical protein